MESVVEEKLDEVSKTFTEWVECDSCRVARATWKITAAGGEIYLCGHHKKKNEAALVKWADDFTELDSSVL